MKALIAVIATIALLFASFSLGRFYEISNKRLGEAVPPSTATSDQRVHLWRGSSAVSPNGRYKAESFLGNYEDYDDYYQIFLTDLVNGKIWRVYNGDFRTSGWDWEEEDKIKIVYNCGTGCEATKIIRPYENVEVNERNGWKVKSFLSF